MRIFICNAFSLSMLDREIQRNRPLDPVYPNPRYPYPVDDPMELLRIWDKAGAEIISVVGHADTAALFSSLLGREVSVARSSIKLGNEDHALVGQYIGPRLPEGATTLPEGATIQWWVV